MENFSLTTSAGASCRITRCGMVIEKPLTLEDWKQLLHALKNVRHAYHCALADAINYGAEHFGREECAAALEQSEFEFSDISRATSIGTLALGWREKHPDLSSEHYLVLSKLEEPAKSKWAKIAARQNLTALEMKRSIEAGEILRMADIQSSSGHGSGIQTIEGVMFKMRNWTQGMGGAEGILKLPETELEKMLILITPVIELAAKIEQKLSHDNH